MSRRPESNSKNPQRQARQRNALAKARATRRVTRLRKRARGLYANDCQSQSPPEDWYDEVGDNTAEYRIVVQPPGPGHRHVVTPAEIRQRLSQLPDHFLAPLEVIQLSRMTRKKLTFPCYGMQWGSTLYLYPLDESLTEYFYSPPVPALLNETRMYGGRWVHEAPETWKLIWTEATIKDYYLNNILIHELGHLLDERNSTYRDRERFAEWFAIEHGYRASQSTVRTRGGRSRPRRRHHAPVRH